MADETSESQQDRIQELLELANEGDTEAFDRLVPLVYEELREIAHRHRSRWTGNETVGTTVLVHEVYLKLAGQDDPDWQHRTHLLAVASRAMRQILIDYARRAKAGKRGGGKEKVSLDQVAGVLADLSHLSASDGDRLLALDESLSRLEEESPRHCRIVECRFFGDMTIEETARALGTSPATVKRGWVRARAWLHRDMEQIAGEA